jgi:hypothetical protein
MPKKQARKSRNLQAKPRTEANQITRKLRKVMLKRIKRREIKLLNQDQNLRPVKERRMKRKKLSISQLRHFLLTFSIPMNKYQRSKLLKDALTKKQ